MIYKIIIRPIAIKFIEKQNKNQRLRLYKAIYNIPKGDIKKWQAAKMIIDFEFGNYRIIYTLNKEELIVLVTKVNNRGQIYK